MIDYAIGFLTVIFVVVCVLMILVILMQRSKQEGLGAAFGSGVTESFLGADASSFLVRSTVFLCSSFYIIAIALAFFYSWKNTGGGARQRLEAQLAAEAATNKPSAFPTNAPSTNSALLPELPTEHSSEVPAAPSTNFTVEPLIPSATNAPAAETPVPSPFTNAAPEPAPAPVTPTTNAPTVTPEPAPATAPAPAPTNLPAPASTNEVTPPVPG